VEDLAVDSTDPVDRIIAFEGEIQIAVPDARVADLRTVADAVEYVEESLRISSVKL
jgi:acyl carrier protein